MPDYVNFETLDFINEVKTTKPIPWINEFDDITSVKKEIQKKMLNELAEVFMIKNKHVEIVIDSFNKVMDSLSSEEQKRVLSKINATKDISKDFDKIEEYQIELEKAIAEKDDEKNRNTRSRKKLEKKIEELTENIKILEKKTESNTRTKFVLRDDQFKFDNFIYNGNNSLNWPSKSFLGSPEYDLTIFNPLAPKCSKCGKLGSGEFDSSWLNFNSCPSCKKQLCKDCYPDGGLKFTRVNGKLERCDEQCPECKLSKS